MNTVLFAAARHNATRGDFLKLIEPDHPAHPSHFTFHEEISRREYERELRGEAPDLQGVTNPVTIITGPPGSGKTTLVRELVKLKHGEDPSYLRGTSERDLRQTFEEAIREGRNYVLFDNCRSVASKSLALFSTVKEWSFRKAGSSTEVQAFPVNLKIYCTGPDLRITADLIRRSRVITLARRPD